MWDSDTRQVSVRPCQLACAGAKSGAYTDPADLPIRPNPVPTAAVQAGAGTAVPAAVRTGRSSESADVVCRMCTRSDWRSSVRQADRDGR